MTVKRSPRFFVLSLFVALLLVGGLAYIATSHLREPQIASENIARKSLEQFTEHFPEVFSAFSEDGTLLTIIENPASPNALHNSDMSRDHVGAYAWSLLGLTSAYVSEPNGKTLEKIRHAWKGWQASNSSRYAETFHTLFAVLEAGFQLSLVEGESRELGIEMIAIADTWTDALVKLYTEIEKSNANVNPMLFSMFVKSTSLMWRLYESPEWAGARANYWKFSDDEYRVWREKSLADLRAILKMQNERALRMEKSRDQYQCFRMLAAFESAQPFVDSVSEKVPLSDIVDLSTQLRSDNLGKEPFLQNILPCLELAIIGQAKKRQPSEKEYEMILAELLHILRPFFSVRIPRDCFDFHGGIKKVVLNHSLFLAAPVQTDFSIDEANLVCLRTGASIADNAWLAYLLSKLTALDPNRGQGG
jgi:hypothetical protein